MSKTSLERLPPMLRKRKEKSCLGSIIVNFFKSVANIKGSIQLKGNLVTANMFVGPRGLVNEYGCGRVKGDI